MPSGVGSAHGSARREEEEGRSLSKDRRKTFIKKGKLDFAQGVHPLVWGGMCGEEEGKEGRGVMSGGRGLRNILRAVIITTVTFDFTQGVHPIVWWGRGGRRYNKTTIVDLGGGPPEAFSLGW